MTVRKVFAWSAIVAVGLTIAACSKSSETSAVDASGQ